METLKHYKKFVSIHYNLRKNWKYQIIELLTSWKSKKSNLDHHRKTFGFATVYVPFRFSHVHICTRHLSHLRRILHFALLCSNCWILICVISHLYLLLFLWSCSIIWRLNFFGSSFLWIFSWDASTFSQRLESVWFPSFVRKIILIYFKHFYKI